MQMVGKTLAYALTMHKFAFCLKNLLEEFIIPKYVNPSYQPLQNCPTVAPRTLQNDQLYKKKRINSKEQGKLHGNIVIIFF